MRNALVTLSGSVRAVPLAEARERAGRAARDAGVTRVTDVTRLDQVGVPVCVAVRPRAQAGSTCVAAGKGLTLPEAQVGALMEAVEQAWMEPGLSRVELVRVHVREILDGRGVQGIIDLAPAAGAIIDPASPITAVAATDVATQATTLVPAELVFHPAPRNLGIHHFGSGSNGAAGGMTVEEATVQGLLEVLERDVQSFHNVRDASLRVTQESLPASIAALLPTLAEARLELHVRALPSVHGLPHFMAVIVDRDQPQMSIRGDGLHLDRDIALQRAVTEALQCRLTIIHGGRDDLDHFVVRFAGLDVDAREAQGRSLVTLLESGPSCAYADVPSVGLPATFAEVLPLLCARLHERGMRRILRVTLTPPDHPAHVVRVIVPGLECRLGETRRLGRRLRAWREGGPLA